MTADNPSDTEVYELVVEALAENYTGHKRPCGEYVTAAKWVVKSLREAGIGFIRPMTDEDDPVVVDEVPAPLYEGRITEHPSGALIFEDLP